MSVNNDVEYTPDFEPSDNNTSQITSVHSEILDEVESQSGLDKTASEDLSESAPFSPVSQQGQKSTKGPATTTTTTTDLTADLIKRTSSKEIDEIEDIIRKLERLEKAQSILESSLQLSDVEHNEEEEQEEHGELPDISERSEKSHESSSSRKSKSSSQQKSATASSKSKTYTSSSDVDGESKHEEENVSDVINAGLESIRKLIEKDLNYEEEEMSVSVASSKSKKSSSASRKSKSQSRSLVTKAVVKTTDGSGDQNNKNSRMSIYPKTVVSTESSENVQQLKNEIIRQEALIEAYQKENEKLYIQLKTIKDEIQVKETSHQDEVNDLNTQIVSLKLSRLVSLPGVQGSNSPRLGSAHKGEVDRLNEELTAKSLMIVELRKEIALLKMEKPTRPNSGKSNKVPPLSIDKEKEYQDNIKNLQKQVRTLQRILYHKDTTAPASAAPSSAGSYRDTKDDRSLASKGRALSMGRMTVPKKAESSSNIVDSQAVRKVEDLLEKERVYFKQQISNKQHIIEEKDLQLNALKIELAKRSSGDQIGGGDVVNNYHAESEFTNPIIVELQSRLSSQSEIIQTLKEQLSSLDEMKRDRNGLRQEVSNLESRMKEMQKKLTRAETMAKPSFRAGSTKSEPPRPTMNQEKEKEYQKQVSSLQKQVRTLQKILYNKDPNAAPGSAPITGVEKKDDPLGGKARPKSIGRVDLSKKPLSVSTAHSSSSATQILQSTLENERIEFEHLLEQKQRQIEEKDKQIKELKTKLSNTVAENAWITSESSADKATYEEFRNKLLTQNKVIDSLRARLASYSNAEAEKSLLRKEIGHFEFRVQDLQRRLARAESLARPENEVLGSLTEKVEDLHTRYYYRERQLDALLDRLSLKTGHTASLNLSPRLLPSSGYHRNYNGNMTSLLNEDVSSLGRGSTGLDMGELSPSATLHLIPHRDVPEI